MAASLFGLASQPQRAAALGRAGRAEVERRFSLEAMIAGYRAIYEAAFPTREPMRAKA
jgi:hypothetical protein